MHSPIGLRGAGRLPVRALEVETASRGKVSRDTAYLPVDSPDGKRRRIGDELLSCVLDDTRHDRARRDFTCGCYAIDRVDSSELARIASTRARGSRVTPGWVL